MKLMAKMELSREAVLRMALRTLQLVQSGSHELREVNPQPKMAKGGRDD
jgi:hypothetical protein